MFFSLRSTYMTSLPFLWSTSTPSRLVYYQWKKDQWDTNLQTCCTKPVWFLRMNHNTLLPCCLFIICKASKLWSFLSKSTNHYICSTTDKKSLRQNTKNKGERIPNVSCHYGIVWRKHWQVQVSVMGKSMNGPSSKRLSSDHNAPSCWDIS